jgi:NADH-quinone oxidoreductase subunit D
VRREHLLAIGTAAGLPCDDALAVDPRHPSSHPGFQLRVTVEDDVVAAADPQVGLMHRSAEKLFESRDLRQAMLLANRHDWLSPFHSELATALAAEEALGIMPPEGATWIRTLLAELERITATLPFLAIVAGPQRPGVEDARASLVAVMESMTGARMHPGFARIGGVASWIDDADRRDARRVIQEIAGGIDTWRTAIAEQTEDLRGVAVLARDASIAHGLGGPVGRASDVDLDLRRDDPYLAYGELVDLLGVPVRTGGDAHARYEVLMEQLPTSVALAGAVLDRLDALGAGPVDVPLPKVVRLPEGTTYTAVEGPLGITGILLVGAGDKYPWRMKVRSASFATMQALPVALAGTPMAHLADAVMSMPMVIGDVDR